MFNTPILFLIFNRPDTTKQVFESIKSIKPKRLYIAADGPRPGKINEAELCRQTRNIIINIDWECDVKTLYRETNLGCKMAVSSAIDWFFENEEQGIILEDDCLPDLSFYSYCEELLDHYKNNSTIMHIGGTNFQKGKQIGNGSYYFSSYNHVWGWASWRRAWLKYDVDLKNFNTTHFQSILETKFSNVREIKYWLFIFNKVVEKIIDTWDYQWLYSIWYHKGICISPNENLVTNIGYNNNGTHTLGNDILRLGNIRLGFINHLKHPDFIAIDKKADKYVFYNFIKPPFFLYIYKKLIFHITNDIFVKFKSK